MFEFLVVVGFVVIFFQWKKFRRRTEALEKALALLG